MSEHEQRRAEALALACPAARRVEVIGAHVLYLGDSAEIIPALGRFDALVTDPPYGIKAAGGTGVRAGKKSAIAFADTGWDDCTADDLVAAAQAIAKHHIIWGGNYYHLPPNACWLVWDKLNGATSFADVELAWTNLPGAARKIDHMWNGWHKRGGEKRLHPTQKPVRVMEWCVDRLPKDAASVFDPFMGSGTTAVAAVNTGRHYVGYDTDADYAALAEKRIASERAGHRQSSR